MRGSKLRPIHPWWGTLALSAGAAVAFAMAFPPIDVWPLVIGSPALLAIAAVGSPTSRRVVGLTLVAQFVLWLWLHRWLVDVSVPGWPLLAVYMAAYPATFVWIVRRILCHSWLSGWPLTVVVPIVWVGLEYFRGSIFMDGYPWFLLGHPLVEAPILVQSADLFGSYFASILAAMIAGLVVDGFLSLHGMRSRTALVGAAAGTVLVITADLAYGAFRLGESKSLKPGPTILAVQTNLPQSNKKRWEWPQQRIDVESFAQLTMEAVAATDGAVDLVVWPETMVPGHGLEPQAVEFLVEHNYVPGDYFLWLLLDLRDRIEAPLLVGSPVRINLGVHDAQGQARFTWDRSFNSVYLIEPKVDPPFPRYDKVFLTPFGETMPYISNWPWLEERLLAIGAHGMSFDLDPGDTVKRLEFESAEGTIVLATPVCFEDTTPSVCRRLVWENGRKAADIIINLSNDGWFGSCDAGRLQHVQIVRFRAIENRVPVVRAANTGLSVHIDSRGIIIATASDGRRDLLRRPGWVAARTTLDGRTTVYGRIGDLTAAATLGLMVVLTTLTFFPRRV